MVKFKVVYFNAGGTLLQLKGTTLPKLYSSILSSILKREITSQSIYQGFRKAEEWTLSRKDWSLFSDLDQRKYQNAFYNQLGISNRKEINRIESELAELIEMDFILNKDAKTLLKQLKSEYQLGIISNWDESLIDLLENLGILDYFESITLSGDIGVNKPDPAIFKAALSDFPDIKAKETVYLGDEYHADIVPAQKLKIFAVFYDQGPTGMHGHPFQPNVKGVRITKLLELPKVLKQYSS
jgi:putative hydrolase of the HAD superfamily